MEKEITIFMTNHKNLSESDIRNRLDKIVHFKLNPRSQRTKLLDDSKLMKDSKISRGLQMLEDPKMLKDYKMQRCNKTPRC